MTKKPTKPTTCRGESCDRPPYARGLCRSHYHRADRQGRIENPDLSPLARHTSGSGRVSLRFIGSLISRLEAAQARTDRTISALVSECVDRSIDRL